MEEDAEKEELKGFLDIIPREEVPIERLMAIPELQVLSEMLEDFDRKGCRRNCSIVKEKYRASRQEGFDLMLWGDLYTLFESDEEDEIWKNQHEYNLISWRLCDFCLVFNYVDGENVVRHSLYEVNRNYFKSRGCFKRLSKEIRGDLRVHKRLNSKEKELIMLMVKAADLEISDAWKIIMGCCN
ncbi:hypothetical protein Tco_1322456 [Tanacetum coccineum]